MAEPSNLRIALTLLNPFHCSSGSRGMPLVFDLIPMLGQSSQHITLPSNNSLTTPLLRNTAAPRFEYGTAARPGR